MRSARVILLAVILAALIAAGVILATRRDAVLVSTMGNHHRTFCQSAAGKIRLSPAMESGLTDYLGPLQD